MLKGLCGLVLMVLLTPHAFAGNNNPSDSEFYGAAQDVAVRVDDLRRVYGCWHAKLGSGHSETHQSILKAAVSTIKMAVVTEYQNSGRRLSDSEAVSQALSLCRMTTGS